MKLYKYLIFLIALNGITLTGYNMVKDWRRVPREPANTCHVVQKAPLDFSVTRTLQTTNEHLANQQENSPDGEHRPFSCDDCEHKKIPPSDTRFWLYILVALGKKWE